MGKEELNAKTPVAPIDMTEDSSCPLLGIFGNDDRAPSPEQVNERRSAEETWQDLRVPSLRRRGRRLQLLAPPSHRPEQAMDAWGKVFAFFGKHPRQVRSLACARRSSRSARAEGMAKRGDEWFPLTQSVVAYDHARHAILGDVITLDFINTDLEPGARAGIELTLETAVELRAALEWAIAAAKFQEAEVRGKGAVPTSSGRRQPRTKVLPDLRSLAALQASLPPFRLVQTRRHDGIAMPGVERIHLIGSCCVLMWHASARHQRCQVRCKRPNDSCESSGSTHRSMPTT